MLIEIITAIVIACLLMWAFSEYLVWAGDYDGQAEFDEEKKNLFEYSLIPPRAVYDSRKIVYFWFTFYKAKYV